MKGHRQHIEGDYKNPPAPGTGEGLHEHSREAMRKGEVFLDKQQRPIVGRALVEMLVRQDVELLVLAMGAAHYHLLGRFTDGLVRPRVGRAKKHATFTLMEHGGEGALWAAGCRVLPITDRSHQVNVFNYIRNHASEGAWVWTFREGVYWNQTRPTPPSQKLPDGVREIPPSPDDPRVY